MKARDYLITKGLAKPSRGRLSREGIEELKRAIREDGLSFSDYTAPAEEKFPRSHRPVAPKIEDKPIVRSETIIWGLDEPKGPGQRKLPIAFDMCTCGKSIQRCSCQNGPQLPDYIGGGPGLMEKPNEDSK